MDRPPVSFYEIDGSQDLDDPDPFNIYSHPSWRPLVELARAKTDCIVRRGVAFENTSPSPLQELCATEIREDAHGSQFITTTIRAGKRTLTRRHRRDRDINTSWETEHLLKDLDDLKAYLALPEPALGGEPDTADILNVEKQLGDAGIAMIDRSEPLCDAAQLFDMATFTVLALTEPVWFHRLVERFARVHYWQVERIARALPGRLWRICGPEYATPPYLPPRLFREYVTAYDTPIVTAIQRHGGYARIHCHGRLKEILNDIAATGCTGLDPIDRGRDRACALPLPPNRTGGFPASGSPVDG